MTIAPISHKSSFLFCIYLSIYGIFTNPVKYLYKGYSKCLEIAENYKDDRFLLICFSNFNQIQHIQEFEIYKESMIISPNDLEFLKDVKEFDEENEIIVGIKNFFGNENEILEDVMEYTGFGNYELVYSLKGATSQDVYRFFR